MSSDPIRLLEDPAVGGLLRGDLATASAARVQGLDHAAGLGALQAAVGAETGAIPAVASGGAGGSLAAKLLIGAALVGGIAWWASPGDGAPAVDPAPVPVAAPASAPEAAVEPTPAVAPAARPPAPATPELVPEEDEPELEPSEPSLAPPETNPKPDKGHAAAHASRDAAPLPPALDDAVVREAKQIQAARRALGTDPGRALSLTQSIAKEFPRGQLVEERLAIAIRALAKLGRMDEARTKAEAFLESYGRGAHATAVRRAVALGD